MQAAAQIRQKRLSHEEAQDEALMPTPAEALRYLSSHRSALLSTFIIAMVWFAQVITPVATELNAPKEPPALNTHVKAQKLGHFLATGSSLLSEDTPRRMPKPSPAPLPAPSPSAASATNEKLAFVVTCALAHTVIVCVGIALGRDTRVLSRHGSSVALLRAGVASFAFLCAVLYLAWEFQIGPVPAAVGAKLNSEAAFVLVGAASMSVWLTCSMLVPHSQLGDKVLAAPSLHGCITAVGAGMALFDLSAGASTAVFVLAGCTGVLASHFSGSFPKSLVWNL